MDDGMNQTGVPKNLHSLLIWSFYSDVIYLRSLTTGFDIVLQCAYTTGVSTWMKPCAHGQYENYNNNNLICKFVNLC